jgi:hypothetical protein
MLGLRLEFKIAMNITKQTATENLEEVVLQLTNKR